MFGLHVDVEDAGVTRLFRAALSRVNNLSPVFARLGMFMRREAGERLKRRSSADSTGKLRASITYEAAKEHLLIGSNLKYAAVQQFGHPRITAKPPLKMLAIPLEPHLRRRGIWPRDLPRDYLFPLKTRDAFYLAHTDDKGKQKGMLRLLYKLVAWVRIPANPYLLFDEKARQFLRSELAKFIGRLRG